MIRRVFRWLGYVPYVPPVPPARVVLSVNGLRALDSPVRVIERLQSMGESEGVDLAFNGPVRINLRVVR